MKLDVHEKKAWENFLIQEKLIIRNFQLNLQQIYCIKTGIEFISLLIQFLPLLAISNNKFLKPTCLILRKIIPIRKKYASLDIIEQLIFFFPKLNESDTKIEYIKLLAIFLNEYENWQCIWIRILSNTSQKDHIVNLRLASSEALFISSLFIIDNERSIQIWFIIIVLLQDCKSVIRNFNINETCRLLKLTPTIIFILLEKILLFLIIRFTNKNLLQRLIIFIIPNLCFENKYTLDERKYKHSYFRVFIITQFIYEILFQFSSEIQYYNNSLPSLDILNDQLSFFLKIKFNVEIKVTTFVFIHFIKLLYCLELRGQFLKIPK